MQRLSRAAGYSSDGLAVPHAGFLQLLVLFAILCGAASADQTEPQADTTFTKVLLPISQRQDLVPEADRVTIILPNDAALQNWMQDQPSAGTEEMVPIVFHGTMEGEFTTDGIINSIVMKREPNAEHQIPSLIGPLIFTTNPKQNEVYVKTKDMRTSARIVMPNIKTCVGYLHITNKVMNTSITYDSLPALPELGAADTSNTVEPGSPEATRNHIPPSTGTDGASAPSGGVVDDQGVLVPEADTEAMFGLVTASPPTAKEEEVEGKENEEGETNLPMVIGISAAVTICVACMSCICVLLCVREQPFSKLFCKSMFEKDDQADNRGIVSKDIGSYPLMPPSTSSNVAPSSPAQPGFYLHYNASRNTSSDIACPSQPFRQTPSGHIVPFTPNPARSSLANPVFIPEVTSGCNPPPSPPETGGGGHVTSMPLRSHHHASASGSSTNKFFAGGLQAWESLGTATAASDSHSNTATDNRGFSTLSANLMHNHANSTTQVNRAVTHPPWALPYKDSERIQESGQDATWVEQLPIEVQQQSLPIVEQRSSSKSMQMSTKQRSSSVPGWVGTALQFLGLDRTTTNSVPNQEAVQGDEGGSVSETGGVRRLTSNERQGSGAEGSEIKSDGSGRGTPTTLLLQSNSVPQDESARELDAPVQGDGKRPTSGGGMYVATKTLFRQGTGLDSSHPAQQPEKSHIKAPSAGGSSLTLGRSRSRSKASSVHHTRDASSVGGGTGPVTTGAVGNLLSNPGAGYVGTVDTVTNPVYQYASEGDSMHPQVESLSKGIAPPQMPAKSEHSEYTASHRGASNGASNAGASAGASNYVSPFPAGLLPAGETSATVTGTDSLDVSGTHPTNRSPRILNLTTRSSTPGANATHATLGTFGTLQLGTHDAHALRDQNNLKMTSGEIDGEVYQSGTPGLLANTQAISSDFFSDDTGTAGLRQRPHNPKGPKDAPGTPHSDRTRSSNANHNAPTGPNSQAFTLYHSMSTQYDDIHTEFQADTASASDQEVPGAIWSDMSGGGSSLAHGGFVTPSIPERSSAASPATFYTPRASCEPVQRSEEDSREAEGCREAEGAKRDPFEGVAFKEQERSAVAELTHAGDPTRKGDQTHLSHACGKQSDGGKRVGSSGSGTRTRTGRSSGWTSQMGGKGKSGGSSRKCVLHHVKTQNSVPDSATGTQELAPPQPGADMLDWKEYLDYQLNSLREYEFLGGLVMLFGPKTRLHGGQAVVQMCAERRSGKECAVKFFLSNSAFLDEAKLYQDRDKPLGRFLPEVYRIINCPAEGFTDAHGVPLPPCIVMEKGESLDHWSARGGDGVDRVTGLQVLTHVSERLTDLHACGYVHRDIKPGNVMWLPRKNRWTLIDFGCAARTDTQARKGFSFSYAAPEVMRGVRAGEQSFEVTEGLDVWSVGILAIEMFTGQPVYSILQSKETTIAMILGEKEAPWENGDSAQFIMRRLGHLKEAVLAALRRNPAERLSMIQFQKACHSVLNSTADTQKA